MFLAGELGGYGLEPAGASQQLRLAAHPRPSSGRLFSLQIPVPPKVFLSLVYKLEGPSDVEVALEITTGDVGSCHVGDIWTLNGEGGRAPPCRPLCFRDTSGKRSLESVPGCGGAGGAEDRCRGYPPCCCGPGPDRGTHPSAEDSGPQPPLGSPVCCAGLGPGSTETWGTGLLPAAALRGRASVWGQGVLSALFSFPPRPQPVGQAMGTWRQQGVWWPLGLPRLVDISLHGFFPSDSAFSSPGSPPPAETSSRHSPRPLRVPPTKLARWVGHCGQQLRGGWVQR